MPTQEAQQGLLPSVLDRLIDPDSAGTSAQRGYSINQVVEAIHRDLEDLLNTRQTLTRLPEDLTEVRGSILGYGLPDLVSLNATTERQREDIGRILEKVVEKYEPRLTDVRATMIPTGQENLRSVRFRIEARLNMEPYHDDVAFDTVLELTTGHYSVQSAAA
jgi:type VI secretion system protein ImpF